jgi:hypothetical protein
LEENEKVTFNETLRVLPPDVLYYNKYGKYAGIAFTMPPCEKTLIVMPEGVRKTVKYSFPYLLVTYNASNVLRLYFAYEPITDKTPLYIPLLPNFGGGVTACLGNVKIPGIKDAGLQKFKIAICDAIFRAIYTAHSNMIVYEEMCTQKKIVKYADKENAGNRVTSIRPAIESDLTNGELRLFKEW